MLKNLLNRLLPSPAPAAQPGQPAAAPVAQAQAQADGPAEAAPPDAAIARADAAIAQGDVLEAEGDLDGAEAFYREAVGAAPDYARAHLNLGIVRAARGDDEGAIASYERVLAIDPQHAFGNYNYGRLALIRGDLPRAQTLLAAALKTRPDFPQALTAQASVLDAMGRTPEAIHTLRAALSLQPGEAGAWFNLASMLHRQARPDEAEEAIRRVFEGEPGHVGALALLARVLRDQGRPGEALQALGPVVEDAPQSWPDRSLELLLMLFADGLPADEIFRRHVQFGADIERAVPERFDHRGERGDPQRRLRVGYLSCDLHLHTVPYFLLPVLQQHDRSQVEVFCYSFGNTQDGMTEHLRSLSDHWRDLRGRSDDEMADAIHADAIDVLVDLVGHTGVPRPGVFCQRPAPVQVSWLGYLNTTGLTRMDYRLTDERADPPALAQPVHTERLFNLPQSQWCYRPMVDEPLAPVAPLEKHGYVTFGSFNSLVKITDRACRFWGETMARLPGSRLIVANVNPEHKRDAIRRALATAGVSADRVEFLPRVALNRYLALYNRVDIAFDSFPYGGGTTTFDALWMGVPVLAARGETSVARSAASILEALGLDEWIAPAMDRWVDTAVARASDPMALLALRRSLRGRLQASPLMDMPRFVRDLESAYRAMWLERGDALSAARP
jgi:protein O-GlcNAc transferase